METNKEFELLQRRRLPADYKYPFGRGAYQISTFTPAKQVMSNDEIRKLLSAELTSEQKYALDVWELLYRCNGINFADLLRMRWDDKRDNSFVFLRKKTENTRRAMQREVIVPITDEVRMLLNRVAVKDSPFILGLLKDGYTEENYDYVSRKNRKAINKVLGEISMKLNLSVPLKLKTARDVYASVLYRGGVSIEKISEMLSHADTKTTRHYLSSMNHEEAYQVNSLLI